VRPWTCLYTEKQLILIAKELGGNIQAPRKGETVTFTLKPCATYRDCKVEWTEFRSDSKLKNGKNAGDRLYRLTQYNKG
jgi:hypothetical protein